MNVGTRSLLFGVHQFAIHPWFVAAAWWRLYGFPFDPRLWVAFFVHDLGYWGKPNMDGAEGDLAGGRPSTRCVSPHYHDAAPALEKDEVQVPIAVHVVDINGEHIPGQSQGGRLGVGGPSGVRASYVYSTGRGRQDERRELVIY